MSLEKYDVVECVQSYDGDGPSLVSGRLYTVEAVLPMDGTSCRNHGPANCFGVQLFSPKLPRGIYWCSGRFKPVYKRNDELFTHLLTNLDEPINEDDVVWDVGC